LERPKTAQQLQQFIGACNWIRSTIPNFSKEIDPLQSLLLQYSKEPKSLKGSVLKKYQIAWDDASEFCFQWIKSLLSERVKLAHLDPDQTLCLFTDASDHFYGIMLSQIPISQVDKAVWEQQHSPVAFLSGKFTSSQRN
jgi:hypothetical protein